MTAGRPTLSHKGEKTPLSPGETLIGSSSECTFRIDGSGVAPIHAAIQVDGAQVTLEDRSPDQETRVNDQRASVVEIGVGQKLAFGEVELQLQKEGSTMSIHGTAGTFPLATGENKVGRAQDCRVQLDDASVSGHHATILVLPKKVLVKDLNSTNGTTVDGRPIGTIELSEGDRIKLGKEELSFEVESATTGSAGGPVMFQLLIDGGSRILSPGELKIGRAPDCKISFDDDAGVSRYHAQITVESNSVRVRDLGSSNGTFVNGSQISSEVTLGNGDRVTVGEHELVLQAKTAVDPLGKTIMASDLKSLTEKTVLMTKGQAGAAAAAAAGSGAWAVLDIPAGSAEDQIRKRYQELFSDYQIRLTNAPTPKLKDKYSQKLEEVREAFAELVPDAAGALASDLPSSKPVDVPKQSKPAAPSPPPETGTPVPPSPGEKKKKKAEPAVATPEVTPEPASKPEKEPLPKSALVMAGLGVLALGLAITMVVLLLGAKQTEANLAATLVEKQQNIERMQQDMVDTQQQLELLQGGKAMLLENVPFKVCNLSTEGSLRVLWLAAAYIDAEDNMASFDSSAVGYHKWTLNPGGSMKFDFIRDDRVIWDGSALFFSMLFKHRGKEYFRSGSMHNLPDDCYKLALDDIS